MNNGPKIVPPIIKFPDIDTRLDLLLRQMTANNRGFSIQFSTPLPFAGASRVLDVEPSELKNIKTDLGFVWWCMLDSGRRPCAKIIAAQQYAQRNGVALMINSDGTLNAYFHCAGLTFRRENGKLADGEMGNESVNQGSSSITLRQLKNLLGRLPVEWSTATPSILSATAKTKKSGGHL